MSKDDVLNPPAFPENIAVDPSGDVYGGAPGMSLRDWFAGQALISLASVNHGNDWGLSGKEHGPICARKAYAIADAMLRARKNIDSLANAAGGGGKE